MEPPIESKYGVHNYFVYDNSLMKCIKGHYMLIAGILEKIHWKEVWRFPAELIIGYNNKNKNKNKNNKRNNLIVL